MSDSGVEPRERAMASFLSAVVEINWSHDSRARFINAMGEIRQFIQPWEADILVWTMLTSLATEREPTPEEKADLRLREGSEEAVAFMERAKTWMFYDSALERRDVARSIAEELHREFEPDVDE